VHIITAFRPLRIEPPGRAARSPCARAVPAVPAIVEKRRAPQLSLSRASLPDFATEVAPTAIVRAGLLRYVVSFRRYDEFHEQCVERIFCDILARCRPAALAVWARYTRRGGLDINPFRATPGADDGGWRDFGSEIRQ